MRTRTSESASYKRNLHYLGRSSDYRGGRLHSPVDFCYRRESRKVTFPDYPGCNYSSRTKQLHTETKVPSMLVTWHKALNLYVKSQKNRYVKCQKLCRQILAESCLLCQNYVNFFQSHWVRFWANFSVYTCTLVIFNQHYFFVKLKIFNSHRKQMELKRFDQQISKMPG